MMKPGSSPRILICRLSAIGDCIHTLPLVSALREKFPTAHLAWITQSSPASLIQDHPQLNEVITVPGRWYRSPSTISDLHQNLRHRWFDFTIDPQSLTKSSALAFLSRAKHRIGFARGQARELSPWLNNVRINPAATHVVDRYLELLGPLGITTPKVEFGLSANKDAANVVSRFLARQGIHDFALLNPGAGWDSKLWPQENYIQIANHLAGQGLRCLIAWAGTRELAWAEQIVEGSGGAAVLAPRTTLPELAALCRAASLFVGSDTGPLHLAAAVGTPCVAMFGPTRRSECGPYGPGHESLQMFHQDGTSKQRRGTDNRAMRAISVGSVAAACDRLLHKIRSGPASADAA